MESAFDQNLVARSILSFVAIALMLGPARADFNATHATNPLWPPHARFHVVWQVLSNGLFFAIALFLLWRDSADYRLHLHLAASFAFVWGIGFYATLASMKRFDGALADVNGIKPFRFVIAGRVRLVDTNLLLGSVLMVVNGIGVLAIRA